MTRLSTRGATSEADRRLSAKLREVSARIVLALTLLAGLASPGYGQEDSPPLEKEIAFGVKMAQRGLWNEALFRFRRAAELRPGDGRILNNLAVAYEAVGQYENALLAYQEAVKVDSANRELKRNYSRFIEFYQAFKPAGESPAVENESEDEPDPAADSDREAPPAPASSGGGR